MVVLLWLFNSNVPCSTFPFSLSRSCICPWTHLNVSSLLHWISVFWSGNVKVRGDTPAVFRESRTGGSYVIHWEKCVLTYLPLSPSLLFRKSELCSIAAVQLNVKWIFWESTNWALNAYICFFWLIIHIKWCHTFVIELDFCLRQNWTLLEKNNWPWNSDHFGA